MSPRQKGSTRAGRGPGEALRRKCRRPTTSEAGATLPTAGPTMSPVARTPYRAVSLGMANPVQPSSSTKPPARPIAMPDSSRAALSSVVTMRGERPARFARAPGAPLSRGAGRSGARPRTSASAHPPLEQPGEQFAKACLSRDENGQQDAGDGWACEHREDCDREPRVGLPAGAREAARTAHQEEAAP